MPQDDSFDGIPSSSLAFSVAIKLVFCILAVLLAGAPCPAQQTGPDQRPQGVQGQPAPPASTVTIPAGTRIALVLTHPVQSRYIHRGNDIYAQVTSPVSSGNEVVIPPGTLVQGKVDKLVRKDRRGQLRLQSMSLTFPNGYVVPIAGPITLESYQGYAVSDPGTGRTIGAFVLPTAGSGLGALIGHAAGGKGTTFPPVVDPFTGTTIPGMNYNPSGLKSTAIGGMVGLVAGGVGSLVLLTTSHNFFLDVGSPVEMVLQQPLSLDQARIADALEQSKSIPVQEISLPPSINTLGTAAKSPLDCELGEERCGGRCVNTISFMNDSSNCGSCGRSCSYSETCTAGSCTCGPAYTSCRGSCVSDSSFLSDSSNCGRCGNSCSFGESCVGGTCMKMP